MFRKFAVTPKPAITAAFLAVVNPAAILGVGQKAVQKPHAERRENNGDGGFHLSLDASIG